MVGFMYIFLQNEQNNFFFSVETNSNIKVAEFSCKTAL